MADVAVAHADTVAPPDADAAPAAPLAKTRRPVRVWRMTVDQFDPALLVFDANWHKKKPPPNPSEFANKQFYVSISYNSGGEGSSKFDYPCIQMPGDYWCYGVKRGGMIDPTLTGPKKDERFISWSSIPQGCGD